MASLLCTDGAHRKTSKQKPSTAQIVASLKLGHKYLIPTLWNDAVDRLRYEFPDQLATYQERREHKSNWSRMRLGKGVPVYLIDAVQSVGLQRILPALRYRAVDKTKIVRRLLGMP